MFSSVRQDYVVFEGRKGMSQGVGFCGENKLEKKPRPRCGALQASLSHYRTTMAGLRLKSYNKREDGTP